MERFQKKDAEAGVVQQPVTDERSRHRRAAQPLSGEDCGLEILHRSTMAGMVDPAARESAEQDYRSERGRIERERDAKIEQARGSR
jgi:hypothetical protein